MPSASPTTNRAAALPPGERRAAIVAAVRPLLLERGEMVTTRQLAEAAGVSEGTLFRVFADKDELLVTALESALDTATFELALGAIDIDTPLHLRLIEATEIIQQRVVDVWRLATNLRHRLREQAARPLTDSVALAALFEPERDRLRIEPMEAARMLRALTLSMTHPMIAGEPKSAAAIVDFFLHGVEFEPAAVDPAGDAALLSRAPSSGKAATSREAVQ